VFAVLGGLLQYVDSVAGIEVWDVDLWRGWLEEQGSTVARLGAYAQVAGAIAGLFGLIVIGMATGVVRTFARDWGFTLERSARGFRRQRGLFTRTDVVMPAHRVQALVIGTGLLRYRFGWRVVFFIYLTFTPMWPSRILIRMAGGPITIFDVMSFLWIVGTVRLDRSSQLFTVHLPTGPQSGIAFTARMQGAGFIVVKSLTNPGLYSRLSGRWE